MSEPVRSAPRRTDKDRPRAPYEAPGIAWEESWGSHASLMAACAKVDTSTFDCSSGSAS